MAGKNKYFIEIDHASVNEKGQSVASEVCFQKKVGNRWIIVLVHGAGDGVRANVMANVVGSMAMSYAELDESPVHITRTILKTFFTGEESYGPDEFSFSMLDVRRNGEVKIAETGTKRVTIIRNEELLVPETNEVIADTTTITLSSFTAGPEDRIVMVSPGIINSGRMTRKLPEGWGMPALEDFCKVKIRGDNTISAHDLCLKMISQAEFNELYSPKHDLTACVVYFRQPRRILVCTGPPFNSNKDIILADLVNNYNGSRLICGGTTAQIVSRELNRDIEVVLKRDPAGLPPTSRMEGVDLITEGVLTLSKVKSYLEKLKGTEIDQSGTDAMVAGMLLEHDIIDFVVGTRINPIHQDPNLPVELELRRNLIRDLAAILENKFLKKVRIQYF